MSQTRVLHVSAETVARLTLPGLASGQGDGHSQTAFVGDIPNHRYITYEKFTLDWTGVGRIVRATWVGYTAIAADDPRAIFRRLTGAFVAGSNADGVFDASDYTKPAFTTSGQKSVVMTKATDTVNRIDITALVNAWAPKTVLQSSGKPGTGAANDGIGLFGVSGTTHGWRGRSNHYSDGSLRPTIELEYDLSAATKPDAPSALTPATAVATLDAFEGNFTSDRAEDTLAASEIEVYAEDETTLLFTNRQAASNSEVLANRFHQVVSPPIRTGVTYTWRARVTSNTNQTSDWSDFATFSITNTPPDAPTITPDGSSYETLTGVKFAGGFSDADGDTLLAYQIQMAPLMPDDPLWDAADQVPWDTGKVFVSGGATDWSSFYGGDPLPAAVYSWRARVWDSRGGVSGWTYATIYLTADFQPAPGSQSLVQIVPRVPRRIVILDMDDQRGPRNIVAVLEDGKSDGASIVFNSPGELHFTLTVDHPQISECIPKQRHYRVEFRQGDGWREVYAGLLWDMDATETGVIFYGIDYLGLLDYTIDERFDPDSVDEPPPTGSKYVTKTISFIVNDQLERAISLENSIVGFISIGDIADMTEEVTIWSTFQGTLQFCAGLIDSHRQGSGKNTRISVVRNTDGGYEFTVVDNPGETRDNLRLRYGELVQGYRVITFGKAWASLMHVIGRTRDGVRVFYKSASSVGVDPAAWGRIAQVQVIDNLADENDALRRTTQAATKAAKLGPQIGLGIRNGFLRPLDGYDLTDHFPVAIKHGAVDTSKYGSGYWTCFAVAYEGRDDGSAATLLTLQPRLDDTPPDPALIPLRVLSPQAEWQP